MSWDEDACYETSLDIPSGKYGKLIAIPGGPGPTGPQGPPGESITGPAGAVGPVGPAGEVSAAALADNNNAAPNLLMDGMYERDATWWAAEIAAPIRMAVEDEERARVGVELSTEQAFTGAQSLKFTGPRSHYPHVTSPGAAGSDQKACVKSHAGRVYRLSFQVFRAAGNSTAGIVRGRLFSLGNNGVTDNSNGAGPNTSMNQADIPTGVWTPYVNHFVVPSAGTNFPYVGVIPILSAEGVGAADVFYFDNVRLEDITNSPAELVAPPPTGVRATDTARLQALVDLAQTSMGTVVLRAGTYAADIVTKKLNFQPRIVGQGRNQTLIDGTIKFVGVSSRMSGGWLENLAFTGSHAGKSALEFSGVCDVHWENIGFIGTFDTGILFHNEGDNTYTEVCSGVAHFSRTVKTAVEYKVSSGGTTSFHGSGLEPGSNIVKSQVGPAVLVRNGCRPYNSPMSVRVWTADIDFPVIQQDGLPNVNFFGNLCVEAGGDSILPAVGAVLAGGTNANCFYQGTLSTYLGGGQITYGSFRLVNSVAATTATGISIAPVVFNQLHGSRGQAVAALVDNASATNYLTFGNSTGRPQIAGTGTAADVGIQLYPKGPNGDVNIYRDAGQRAILSASGADAIVDLHLSPKGSGSAVKLGAGANATGLYSSGVTGTTPEAVLNAYPASLFFNNAGTGGSALWVKETGTAATGWSPLLSKRVGDTDYSAKGHTHVAGDVVGAAAWVAAPATPTSPGTVNQIARGQILGTDHLFVCTATNVWKAVPLSVTTW
jgi:hypothetical protein